MTQPNQSELEEILPWVYGETDAVQVLKLKYDRQAVYSETVRLYEANNSGLYDYINNHTEWYWS